MIIHGDSLEELKKLESDSIDAVITDPPYGIGGKNNKLTKQGDRIVSNAQAWGEWDDIPDFMGWCGVWLTELYRVCRGGCFVFFDLNTIGQFKDLAEGIGFYPKNFFVIIKNNPLPHFRKTGYRSGFEMGILLMRNKDSKFNFLSQGEMVNVKHYNIGQKFTTHPTEKPLNIVKHLVRVLTDEGDTILDPFVGSGTTCLAAKNLKRKYIGIERELEYVEIARARLDAEKQEALL